MAMNVMMTNATSLEEQVNSLSKIVENLSKIVQERDHQIEAIMNKMNNAGESSQAPALPKP